MHVHGDAGRRVQRDRRPDRVDIRFRDAVAAQELARRVRAVDFEALPGAAVPRDKSQVMEHRSRIQKLRIEAQAAALSGQRAEMIDPARVMEEQRRDGIADQLGDLARKLAVGRTYLSYGQRRHRDFVPWYETRQIVPLPSSVTKSEPSLATATPTGRPQTSLSESTSPVMKSSYSPVALPAASNSSRTTLYPVRWSRFHDPCMATKALPLYPAGKLSPW